MSLFILSHSYKMQNASNRTKKHGTNTYLEAFQLYQDILNHFTSLGCLKYSALTGLSTIHMHQVDLAVILQHKVKHLVVGAQLFINYIHHWLPGISFLQSVQRSTISIQESLLGKGFWSYTENVVSVIAWCSLGFLSGTSYHVNRYDQEQHQIRATARKAPLGKQVSCSDMFKPILVCF